MTRIRMTDVKAAEIEKLIERKGWLNREIADAKREAASWSPEKRKAIRNEIAYRALSHKGSSND